MNTDESLTWVREHMPQESAQALYKFTGINPRYQGAGWDDCLEVLLDSDSHLDVTEPLYDDTPLARYGALPAAVAITLLYASEMFAKASPEHQWNMVNATIVLNKKPDNG